MKTIGKASTDEDLFQFSLQENFSYLKILAPPVSSCKFCFRKLTQVRGKATQVVFFGQDGPIPASKFIYRCRGCPIFNEGTNEKTDVIYHPTMFGNKAQGMRFYEESIGYTSASNVCYIDDRLLEMCASSNHHSWASLEGFSETINEFFRNCKLTRVNVERTKLFFSHIKMEKEEADMSDGDEETQNWCYWHELLPRQLRYGFVKWHVYLKQVKGLYRVLGARIFYQNLK